MSTIFDSIKGLITPDIISKASSFLGEDESNVTKAVTSIVPSILGSLLAKGENPGIESALLNAGKESGGILENISGLFSGDTHEKSNSIGTEFLSSILGNKLGGFTSLISSISGISSDSSNKLTSMIAPVIAGVLGNKLTSGGFNLSSLLGLLNKEKGSFLDLIPSGLGSLFGLSSLSGLGSSLSSGISNAAKEATETVEEAASGGMGWLKWLVGLLAIGLLGFFLFKACSNRTKETITATTTIIDSTADKVNSAIDRVSEEFSLPDGLKMTGYKGGIEDQMIAFLGSDEYKNATPETLKDKWFDFDNIEFKHGSATELTEGSSAQLNNIVSILKYFKDVKVKVGGYTDKTGTAEANLKLSQERANTIKSILEKGGVDTKRLNAEGYGDKFAKYGADASDADRIHDRKIALRFEK